MTADASQCTGCGGELPATANFCPTCGQKVDSAAQPPVSQKRSGPEQMLASTSEGERRQITVMFCDLVDCTSLSDRLDPEDVREVFRQYHAHAETVVESFGGAVAQYLGDGVLVYFGAAQANEDDPERAILAALKILDGIAETNSRLPHSITSLVPNPIRVRIGVHTGPVVVDPAYVGERQDSLAWGVTINVAARLEALAPEGGCVISEATRKLVSSKFKLESIGLKDLKGFEQPIEVHRVLSPTSRHLRNVNSGKGESLFVGRESEMERLFALWGESHSGNGQVLRVSGEPGIGKTRLIHSFKEAIEEPHIWIEIHCSAYHKVTPYFPVIEALRHALEFRSGDSAAEQLDALDVALEGLEIKDSEALSLLSTLLSIPLPENSPAATGDSELLRKKTMQLLCNGVHRLSNQRPVVLLVEDIQWIDASTLELLELLLGESSPTRLLTVVTHRSGFEPSSQYWQQMPALELEALSAEQSLNIIRGVMGAERVSDSVLQNIVDRSDGVPLFAEEFARSVSESGDLGKGKQDDVQIPATLQDSLTARLDRLGKAREVAQLAAVLGRRFRLDQLEALSPLESSVLERSLEELNQAQLLEPVARAQHESYFFKHGLIQQAAYESLLRRKRRELHIKVVEMLEERFQESLEETPEVVARHCEAGELPDKALEYWRKAAFQARQSMALMEEIDHLRRAVTLLQDHLPESRERDEQELELRLALTEQLLTSSGMASDEAEQQSIRASELCEKLESHDKLFMALLGRAFVDLGRSRYRSTLQISDKLTLVATRLGTQDARAQAALPIGGALGMTGDPSGAFNQLQAGATAIEEAARQGTDRHIADGLRTVCITWAADNLWLLGFPDRALEFANRALADSQAEGTAPSTRAQGLVGASTVAVLRGDTGEAALYASQLIALAEQNDLPFGVAHGGICSGWAQAEQGSAAQGVSAIQHGLDSLATIGTNMKRTFYLCLLANAGLRAGMHDVCDSALQEAQDFADEYEEVFFLAEILRLRGALSCAMHDYDRAREHYERAIDVAKHQGARMLQLRATTSLSLDMTCADQNLAPLYDSFHEGSNTQDLARARQALTQA